MPSPLTNGGSRGSPGDGSNSSDGGEDGDSAAVAARRERRRLLKKLGQSSDDLCDDETDGARGVDASDVSLDVIGRRRHRSFSESTASGGGGGVVAHGGGKGGRGERGNGSGGERGGGHHRTGSGYPLGTVVSGYPAGNAAALGIPVAGAGTGTKKNGGKTGSALGPRDGVSATHRTLDKVRDAAAHWRSESCASLADEDSCPICFEAYDDENPKMPLRCEHHFHLGCVFEWFERSELCPVCEEKMEFAHSVGMTLSGE